MEASDETLDSIGPAALEEMSFKSVNDTDDGSLPLIKAPQMPSALVS